MATCLSAQMVLPRAVSATSVSQLCAPSPCCLESVPFIDTAGVYSLLIGAMHAIMSETFYRYCSV